MRQSSTWLKNTAVSLLMMVLVVYGTIAYADPKQDAATAANGALSKFGSSGALNQNALGPLSGNGLMTSISGTGAFNAAVRCPTTARIMSITMLPSGTGDLSMVLVEQDTNVDGTNDYSYVVPVRVSGICTNGVISCDAGTWNNCSFYKWQADSGNYTVQLASTPNIQTLAGCYCINNSCGANIAMMQTQVILSNLGMGVATSIQQVNPTFLIADAKVNNTTIEYYGSLLANCTMPPSGPGTPSANASQYYSNPAQIQNDAQAAVTSQMTSPTSIYSGITQLSDNLQNQGSFSTCSIQRNVTIDQQVINNAVTWLPWASVTLTSTCCGNVGSVYATVDLDRNGSYDSINNQINIGMGWYSTSAQYASIVSTQIQNLQATHSVPFTEIRQSTVPYVWPAGCSSGNAAATDQIWCWGDGGGSGDGGNWSWYRELWERKSLPNCPADYTYFDPNNACYKETLVEAIVNNCASIESNQNCSLKQEIVDGVTTFNNYQPTGLSPVPTCNTITGVTVAFDSCQQWWGKTRSYSCRGSGPYDFSDAKTRATAIQNSIADTGTTLSYSDTYKDAAGNWVAGGGTVTHSTADPTTCPQACKISKPKTNTQAGPQGNQTQFQTTNAGVDFIYKSCSAGSCPVDTVAGESITKNCQCINDFAEAATIMQILHNAGKDLICSTGTRQ